MLNLANRNRYIYIYIYISVAILAQGVLDLTDFSHACYRLCGGRLCGGPGPVRAQVVEQAIGDYPFAQSRAPSPS